MSSNYADVVRKIKKENNIDIDDLLEEYNAYDSYGMCMGRPEEIDRFLEYLVSQIGIEKTKLFAEQAHAINLRFMINYEGKGGIDTKYSAIDELNASFKKAGINFDTGEVEDEELFKKFIFKFWDMTNIDLQLVMDFKDYINDWVPVVIEPDKKENIISKAAPYLLYKTLQAPIPSFYDIVDLIDNYGIRDIYIPKEFTMGIMEDLLPGTSLGAVCRSINVDEDNPSYKSIDGVLYSKDGSELLFYPSLKKGKSFTIPDFVTKINKEAINGIYKTDIGLESILVDKNNNSFQSIDGVVYSKDGKTLVAYPCAKKDDEFILPEIVDKTLNGELYGAQALKKIVIKKTRTNDINKLVHDLCGLPSIFNIEILPPSKEDAIEFGFMDESDSPEIQENQYTRVKKILKAASFFLPDNNYNYYMAFLYVQTMFDLFGEEETRNMLRFPQSFKHDEFDSLDEEWKSKIGKYYEPKYQLNGYLPVTTDILKYLYGATGKKEGKKLFERINERLDSDGEIDKTFDERVIDSAKELNIGIDPVRFKNTYKDIIQREYRRNEVTIRETIVNKLSNNQYVINGHLGVIAGLLEKTIRQNYFQEGNIDSAREILRDELLQINNDGEFSYQGILGLQEIIESVLSELYSENTKLIQNNIGSKIQEVKQIMRNGWISRILCATDKINLDSMTQEELDGVVKKLGQELKTVLDFNTHYELKPDADIYNIYTDLGRMSESPIITMEKAEAMFSSLQRPYSENFKKWFLENKKAIISNPEIFDVIPGIHNSFDRAIVNDPLSRTMLENGLLDANYVFNKFQQVIGLRNGNFHDRLSYWASRVNFYMDDDNYDELEKIFEITKQRERSYIPSAEKTEKVGNVKYRGRILRADDPLNILLGNATNCCQKLGDVGENTMRHAAMENTGRTFVVEEISEDGTAKIVAQSWVWRNNGVLCFDNIEIPRSEQRELKIGNSDESVEKQKAIFSVYQNVAKTLLEKDKKKFDKLLRQGKITQEQYDSFVLKLITVGTGYNDLGILTELNLEEVEPEDEEGPMSHLPFFHYNINKNDGNPWIDSGLTYGNDGKQLVLAGSIDERKKQDKSKDIAEIPLELMYKNPREVFKCKGIEVNAVIDDIKAIENKTYRNAQKLLQNANDYIDIAYSNLIDPQRLQVHVSANHDWYMIFEERDDCFYIADIAATAGKNSESKETEDGFYQSLEAMESLYDVMQQAAQSRKKVYLNATEDTSYTSILSLAKAGILSIDSDEIRPWGNGSKINMHDMWLTVDLEKVTKELERVRKHLEKRKTTDFER